MNVGLMVSLIHRFGRQSVRFGHVDLYWNDMQHLQYISKLQFILSLLQDNFVLHYELVAKRSALPSVAQNVR